MDLCLNHLNAIGITNVKKIDSLGHVLNNCSKGKAVSINTTKSLQVESKVNTVVIEVIYSDIQFITHTIMHDTVNKKLTIVDQFITNKSIKDGLVDISDLKSDKKWLVGLEDEGYIVLKKDGYETKSLHNINTATRTINTLDVSVYNVDLK